MLALSSIRRLAFLGLLLAGPACRSDPGRLLDRAHEALNADDYQTAAQLFREITIAFPESPLSAAAHYELAQIYHLRIRDVPAAEASLLKILSDYPESPLVASSHALLGRIYERDLGAPEKAPAHYEESLRFELPADERREVLLALGDCFYRLDREEEAESSYRRAVALPYDPSSDAAYLRLATLSRLRGDDDEALELLEALVERTKDRQRRQQALRGEVEILIEAKRFSEAEERLRRARRELVEPDELEELQTRLQQVQIEDASFTDEGATIEELEQRIRWGAGRRRAREPR